MSNEVREECTALVVHNARELGQALVANRDKAHLLTPFALAEFSEDIIAPGFRPSLRMTKIDTVLDHGEVYEPWEKRGSLALTKKAIDKLAQLAGIEWNYVTRVDDGSDPLYAHYKAKGTMLEVDGTERSEEASRPINLNEGSPEAEAMKANPGMLKKARQNIAMYSESKAKNRVVRALLGIQSSFKPEELQKPFVVLKIVPDMNDPEVRRMVQAKMLHLEKYLFQAEHPREIPPELPPASPGASGLELPEPPAGQTKSLPAASNPPIDIKPEPLSNTLEQIRAEKIKAVQDCYYTKTTEGKRDPNKRPLESLPDNELDEILKLFKDMPTVRMKQESLI